MNRPPNPYIFSERRPRSLQSFLANPPRRERIFPLTPSANVDTDALWTQFSELSAHAKHSQSKGLFSQETLSARHKLRAKCIEIIENDITRAVDNDVLLTVWKLCFYKPIEHYRRIIRKSKSSAEIQEHHKLAEVTQDAVQFLSSLFIDCLDAAQIDCVYTQDVLDEFNASASSKRVPANGGSESGTSQSSTKRSSVLSEICLLYKLICDEAGTFVDRLSPGFVRSCGTSARVVHKNAIKSFQDEDYDRMWNAVVICQKCLIYIGDLHRYRELVKPQPPKRSSSPGSQVAAVFSPRDFTLASQAYKCACRLIPSNGNPHNQLAVVATYEEEHLRALYQYFLSLSVKTPFPTAKNNVGLLFEKVRRKLFTRIGEGLMKSSSNRLRSLRMALLGGSNPNSGEKPVAWSSLSSSDVQSLLIHLRDDIAQIDSLEPLCQYIIYIFSVVFNQEATEIEFVRTIIPCTIDKISQMVLRKLKQISKRRSSSSSSDDMKSGGIDGPELGSGSGTSHATDRVPVSRERLDLIRLILETYFCAMYLVELNREKHPPECVGFREIVSFVLLLSSACMRQLSPSESQLDLLSIIALGCKWLTTNFFVVVPDLELFPWKHSDVTERDLEAPNEMISELANLLNMLSELPECTDFELVEKVRRLIPIEHELIGTVFLDIAYSEDEQHTFFEERRCDENIRRETLALLGGSDLSDGGLSDRSQLSASSMMDGDGGGAGDSTGNANRASDDDIYTPQSQPNAVNDEDEDEDIKLGVSVELPPERGHDVVVTEATEADEKEAQVEEEQNEMSSSSSRDSKKRLKSKKHKHGRVTEQEYLASLSQYINTSNYLSLDRLAHTAMEQVESLLVFSTAEGWVAAPLQAVRDGHHSGDQMYDVNFHQGGYHSFDPFGLEQPYVDPRLLLQLGQLVGGKKFANVDESLRPYQTGNQMPEQAVEVLNTATMNGSGANGSGPSSSEAEERPQQPPQGHAASRRQHAQSSSPPPAANPYGSYTDLFEQVAGPELTHAAHGRNNLFSASGNLLSANVRRAISGQNVSSGAAPQSAFDFDGEYTQNNSVNPAARSSHRSNDDNLYPDPVAVVASAGTHPSDPYRSTTQDIGLYVALRRQKMINRLGGEERYMDQSLNRLRMRHPSHHGHGGDVVSGDFVTQNSRPDSGMVERSPQPKGFNPNATSFVPLHDLGVPVMQPSHTHLEMNDRDARGDMRRDRDMRNMRNFMDDRVARGPERGLPPRGLPRHHPHGPPHPHQHPHARHPHMYDETGTYSMPGWQEPPPFPISMGHGRPARGGRRASPPRSPPLPQPMPQDTPRESDMALHHAQGYYPYYLPPGRLESPR